MGCWWLDNLINWGRVTHTVYPKKYAHGFCFAVLCCGYTLTDFPIFIRLTSLALWQSNDCPSASKATLMNMDTYFMWIQYEWLHNHNKAKHNKTVCIFLGIYCICVSELTTIGSGNGLSPGRRQTIIWTNDGILLIEPLGTNFSEILFGTFSFNKMHFKLSSGKRRPFRLGLNMFSLLPHSSDYIWAHTPTKMWNDLEFACTMGIKMEWWFQLQSSSRIKASECRLLSLPL